MIYFSTSPFVAWILLFAYVAAVAEAAVPAFTYKAVIKMIPGMPSNVTGTAIVFSIDGESTLGYAGMIDGLNPSSIDACTIAGAPDGCGVHLHSGFTCENAMQGENYFAPPVSKDPWTGERYGYVTTATTNSTTPTSASFAGIVDVGSASQLSGRAFVGK